MPASDPPPAPSQGVRPVEPDDGAAQSSPSLFGRADREIPALRDVSLDERLAAFEDLIDSEVGDTDLSRARHLERAAGLRHLYLKFEGGNPTGTQKDRIAFAQAFDALRRGFDTLTVATCGNYGVAVALAARWAGLRTVVYIPAAYHTRRITEMASEGAEIVRAAGDYEAAVEASRERARADDLYDANPGGANTALQLAAYGRIAYEIYDELRDAPAIVAVPVSNGSTLAGIYKGFVSLYRRGKTSHIPRLVGGSSARNNPIIKAWRQGLDRCSDLPPGSIRETAVNEPLVNWRALDGDLALAAIRASGGWASDISDRALLRTSRRLRDDEGYHVLPAATAGLVALLEGHDKTPLPGDRYVAVLTGRNR